MKVKCTGFKKNTVRKTTRDSVSSSVSASTKRIKARSIKAVVLRINRELKAVAGKEWEVSYNRPSRLLRPKLEDLMMKMQIEA